MVQETSTVMVTASAANSSRYNIIENDEDYDEGNKITFYRILPWVKESVKQIFVLPIDLPKEFYREDETMHMNGETYFLATNNYFKFRTSVIIEKVDENGVVEVITKDASTGEAPKKFKQAVVLKNGDKFVQNAKMYDTEKKYLEEFKKTGLSIEMLKRAPISRALINVANTILNETSTSINVKTYVNNLVNAFAANSNSAYEFAVKIAQFNLALKNNKEILHKIKVPNLSAELLQYLSNNDFLFGNNYVTEIQKETIDNTIEDSAINMLIYTEKFYSEKRTTKKTNTSTNDKTSTDVLDVSIKHHCANLDSIRSESEEDLVFFHKADGMFCFDIYNIVDRFSKGNYTVPDSNGEETFPKEFVDKISVLKKNIPPISIKKYKLLNNGSEALSDVEQKKFDNLYKKVLYEVSRLDSSTNVGCKVCKTPVDSVNVLNTITTDGEIISLCSKECFDRL